MENNFLLLLGLLALGIASYWDIKKKEIPDWVNFSLMGSGILTIIFTLNFPALLSFGLTLILGNLAYHYKVWGGGDTKLLMALGSIIPNIKLTLIYLCLLILILGFYVLIFGLLFENKPKKHLFAFNLPLAPAFLISYIIFLMYYFG